MYFISPICSYYELSLMLDSFLQPFSFSCLLSFVSYLGNNCPKSLFKQGMCSVVDLFCVFEGFFYFRFDPFFYGFDKLFRRMLQSMLLFANHVPFVLVLG